MQILEEYAGCLNIEWSWKITKTNNKSGWWKDDRDETILTEKNVKKINCISRNIDIIKSNIFQFKAKIIGLLIWNLDINNLFLKLIRKSIKSILICFSSK